MHRKINEINCLMHQNLFKHWQNPDPDPGLPELPRADPGALGALGEGPVPGAPEDTH